MPSAVPATHMAGMRSAPGKPGLDLSHAENVSLVATAGRGSLAAVLASFT